MFLTEEEAKAKWSRQLAMCAIPYRMWGSLIRWIEYGIEPGSFLEAVLTNDLTEAVGRADDENIRLLFNYVNFLYNFAPGECWGSREKMTAWETRKDQERRGAE